MARPKLYKQGNALRPKLYKLGPVRAPYNLKRL